MDAFAMLGYYRADMPSLLAIGLEAARQNNDRLGEANTLKAIGDCESDPKTALLMFQSALKTYVDVGDKYSQARILVVSIADTYTKLQQPELALQTLQQARQLFTEISFDQGVEIVDNQIQALQHPAAMTAVTSQSDRESRKQSLIKKQPLWLWFGLGIAVVLVIWWLKHR
jgi:hypothetical protein